MERLGRERTHGSFDSLRVHCPARCRRSSRDIPEFSSLIRKWDRVQGPVALSNSQPAVHHDFRTVPVAV